MAESTCQIDGCDRPHFSRGWCAAHWGRVRRNGEPGSPEVRSRRTGCKVDGCEGKHAGHGYCRKHRYRWAKHGDPLVTGKPGPRVGHQRVDEVSYRGAHDRVLAIRGRAAQHDCHGCGNQATDWAYTNRPSPSRRFDLDQRLYYSIDIEEYAPMCRSCHRIFDYTGLSLDAWLAKTSPAPDAATSAERPDVFRAASAGEAHDLVTETGHHRCLRCGAESMGAAPALPCIGKFHP